MIRYTALNLVGCKKFFSGGMQFSKLLYGINTDYLHVKETLQENRPSVIFSDYLQIIIALDSVLKL